ncbi:MAG: nucleoside triphosphate pyrophosphohydrolase [Ruminococcaceae bacterium]|nr:nucleoside triphosphate pyrophosphohydrolase [Oscillospiraceae bacterium]
MAIHIETKERYTTEDLLFIMKALRSPEGCPWDREQTNRSIRTNFIEETYEAIEAIDNGDDPALCEELGDVLMQVVFHAQMASEEDRFSYDDVVDGVCKKLIVRHPHVFGDGKADDAAAVLKTWDAIKRQTKGTSEQSTLLRNLPRALPALMRAAKVQERAARVGFDWPTVDGALAALSSEADELREAIAQGDKAHIDEEFGDLLFSAVNVSRFLKTDAEMSLNAATDKFIRRFTRVEALAAQRGIDMQTASLEELDALWDIAKAEQQ